MNGVRDLNINDAMIKDLCSDMIYKRGCEYFSDGRVHMKKRSETEISAAVDGEEIYNVYIRLRDGKIESELCTCPYYETMQSPCKHIIAVLKQRQAELLDNNLTLNENDNIAKSLCHEFSESGERKKINAVFELFIKQGKTGEGEFEMSLSLPELGGSVQSLENFLDCYLGYRDFKMDRFNVYSRRKMYFPEHEDMIIKIMAEVYQTRSSGIDIYRKASSKTSFGSAVMRRILPHLSGTEFSLVFDGLRINGARVLKEDPDILIDVEAFGKDIVMSLSENGFAITTNGEWFFYNDTIYNTTPVWRDYFMPIYRSLSQSKRTQITFKNDNAMMFAKYVLPKLKNRHGVVISGVDEIVIDDTPQFFVHLDCEKDTITAVISVRYGTMQFRLPSESTNDSDKIIIRKHETEEKLLLMFSEFVFSSGIYRLHGDEAIYKFITEDIKKIAELATVSMSDGFKALKVRDDFDLTLTARYRENTDYLEIGFNSEFSKEEMSRILAAVKNREAFYHANDGSFINLGSEAKHSVLSLLKILGVTEQDLLNGSKLLPKSEMLRLEASGDVKKDKTFTDYLEKLHSIVPQIPNDLHGELRKYQKVGITWFSELSELGMGGILADDMGLGKTLQTIAYIHGIRPDKPTLIVAPGTLVYNWQREIEKFTPDASYIIINGNKETREALLKDISGYEFVITSYPLLRRDISLYRDIEFSYCFIDEAQYIKNSKTMNAISVKRINASHKFALTGTPIENSVMELWSIFDFIMPGYLKSAKEFKQQFDDSFNDEEISEHLRNIIRPFVLRRMKSEVLNELPEKIETTMLAELSRDQKGLYQALVTIARDEAAGVLRERGGRMTILTSLLRLRQICDHPMLYSGDKTAQSGKLDLLMGLVRDANAQGRRILVFSQFRSMLDIIADALNKANYKTFTINGYVPLKERINICEKFNSGEGDVILVSLKAGGTGINLTGADMVIHFDPWWNPAVIDQATDRAYRIGQMHAVNVIKLATQGTIEEKMLRLESKKRDLAGDIIRSNSKTLKNLTDDEIMSLFEA